MVWKAKTPAETNLKLAPLSVQINISWFTYKKVSHDEPAQDLHNLVVVKRAAGFDRGETTPQRPLVNSEA